MSYSSTIDEILVSQDGGILTVALNRPKSLNALLPEMIVCLGQLVSKASLDRQISVVVIEGVGRAFSAGVDLKVLKGSDPSAGKIGDAFDKPAMQAFSAIRSSNCPVIAKVHGACFTGALELALHCDFIYTTVDTKFGDTHAKFALRPTWGMPQNLSRAIGVRQAKELSFTARTITGDEAARLGIANAAVQDKAELDELVNLRSREILSNSRATVAAMKDLYDISQMGLSLENSLQLELHRDYPAITDTNERLSNFKAE